MKKQTIVSHSCYQSLMANHHLDRNDGEWWNLENLQIFGSKAAWVTRDYRVWWRLSYLAEAFQPSKGAAKFNSWQWLTSTFAMKVDTSKEFVSNQLRICNVGDAFGFGLDCVYLWTNSVGNSLQEHVAQTVGLMHFWFHYGEVCRDETIFERMLDRIKMIGVQTLEFSVNLREPFTFRHLQAVCGTPVSGGVMVSGFLQSLRNRFQHILPTVRRIWSELNAEGHIQEPFPASVDAHVGFVDLMVFTFFALRWRKKQSKNTAPTLMQLIGLLRFDFIGVISISVNSFIEKKVRHDDRFAISRNLPAIRRKPRGGTERPVRVDVDPETIWALIESASCSGISLRQALLLKKNDALSSPDLAGASESKADYWERKIQGMYMNRVQTVFRMITQLSLVADASTHSDKEMLVSCAFSPEKDLGCHAPVQHLNTGSLKPSEVDISILARIAKNRKLQRMSAFRQLQAIDHQLALLSGNRLGLDAFSLKNVAEEGNDEEMTNEKKRKSKKANFQGRFPTAPDGRRTVDSEATSSAKRIVDRTVELSPQNVESTPLAGHIVDHSETLKPPVEMSMLYASHSGIVDVNEVRSWKIDAKGNSFEVVENEKNNTSLAILPQQKAWWQNVPLLVLSLDQGPVGTAGMAFALQGHRIHVRFDKIHRCIRDYKLAIGRAMGGIFLKTQLHSSYIFGLNYKPFGSGLYSSQKQTMMASFCESQTILSDLWQEFRERIAFDAGESVINDNRLWESMSELESFKNKGTLIKPARWFSWNQCCDEFLPEFHTLKMLCKYEYGDNIRPLDEIDEDQPEERTLTVSFGHKVNPETKQSVREDEFILKRLEKMKKSVDPRKELNMLKSLCGGFKLAYKLMTEELYDNCRLLACITRPLWNWYTLQIKHCKSPQDALKYSQQMTSSWMKDKHVQETLALLGQPETFCWCQHRGTVHLEKKVCGLVFHLAGLRLWSNSKYSYPPECYSLLLSDDDDVRREVAGTMKEEYECLLDLEYLLVQPVVPRIHPHVKLLHKHIQTVLTVPSRLLMDAFRQDDFCVNTPGEKAARHILNVLLATFADNKIVEDLHGNLRNEARSKVSKKMSFSTMQSVVRSASVLENRSIRHPAKLKKEQFDRDWKDPRKQPRTKLKYVHEAGRHKMGKHWHHVMGPKRWGTLSETTLEQGAAAWRWLQHYTSGKCASDVKLEDAYFSKFAVAHEIFTKNCIQQGESSNEMDVEDKQYFLCLGHSTWACLMWPLYLWSSDEGENFFFSDAIGIGVLGTHLQAS